MSVEKNKVPEGFSLGMSIVDAIPVVFFGLAAIMLGVIIGNPLLYIGAITCFVSGLIKVLWKFVVVIKKKNIWAMFVQMRIAMPIGFVLMIIGFFLGKNSEKIAKLSRLIAMPSLIFVILGGIGMALMFFFAFKLDSNDPRSNWIEQIVNGVAQFFFFLAMLLIVI